MPTVIPDGMTQSAIIKKLLLYQTTNSVHLKLITIEMFGIDIFVCFALLKSPLLPSCYDAISVCNLTGKKSGMSCSCKPGYIVT